MSIQDVYAQLNRASSLKGKDGKLKGDISGLTNEIIAYAEATDKASLSAENFYASQIKSTNGFTSIIQVLRTYNGISQQDLDTRKEYANAVAQTNQALGQTLIDLNGANASTSTLIKTTVGLTAKTIALTAAETALNFALNAGIGLLIGGVVAGINAFVTAQEKANQKLVESTEELKSNTDEIEDYKEKVLSLRESLDSGTLSFEEQENVRESLMKIQDEMINKYGKEIKQVDILKSSVDELSDAYANISQGEAERWYADNRSELNAAIENVNSWGGTDRLSDLSSAISDLQKKQAFKTVDELKDYFSKANVANAFLGIEDLNIESILRKYETKKSQILKNDNNTLSEEQASAQALNEVYSEIVSKSQKLYDYATKRGESVDYMPKWMEEFASTVIGDRQGFLDEDIDIYKESGVYLAKIFNPDLYEDATEALRKYNKALAEDNPKDLKSASDKIKSIYNGITDQMSEVPEKYHGVIREYYEELLGDIAHSNDKIIEQFRYSERDLIHALLNSSIEGSSVFSPYIRKIYNDLSDEEIDTLMKIIQGEIDTGGIDWLASLTPEKVKERLQTIIKASSFDFADFFNVRTVDDTGKTLKEIIDDQVNPLKTAYETLSNGGTLDTDFFIQFPDLLQYTDDVDNLKVHILELIKTATNSSLKELRDMYNSTNDENIKAILGQAIKLLEVDININEEYKEKENLIKKNIQAIDEEIKAVNKEIEAQKEEREILEKQKELLEEQASKYESAAAAVTRQIDKQIEALERQKAAVEDYYGKQIEALKEEAEERDRINELREKELALEKAKNTKVRVYSKSRGWTIQTDTEEVEKAQKEYDDTVRNNQIEDLEKEKEAALANYDAQIEAWNTYKDSWQEAIDAWKNGQDEMNAAAVFGTDWREKIANKDVGIMNQYKTEYGKIEDEIADITDNKIKKVDEEIENLEKKLDVYENLKTDQKEYLDFYKNYSSEFARATKEQTEALREFGEVLERYRGVDGFIDMFKAYEEMRKQFDNDYESQGEKYSDTERENGKYKSPKTTNSAQTKLNNFLNSALMRSVPTSINSAFSKANTVFNGLPSKDYNYTQTKVNNNSGVTYNQRTWNMNGSVIVDSYDKFKEYFDRYVREAKQDLVVGR